VSTTDGAITGGVEICVIIPVCFRSVRSNASSRVRNRCQRSATCTAWGASDDFHAGMDTQPRAHGGGTLVRKQVNRPRALEINADGAVRLSFAAAPNVNPKHAVCGDSSAGEWQHWFALAGDQGDGCRLHRPSQTR
jgi:hypothetical protein